MFKNKLKKEKQYSKPNNKKKTKKIGKRDEMTNISPTEAIVFCRQIINKYKQKSNIWDI